MRKSHTPPTSMVPFLRFNLAETTSVWPSQGGGQAGQEPNSVKTPAVEAEREENFPCRGSDKKPSVLETQTAKNELSRKLTWLSLRFQKTSG